MTLISTTVISATQLDEADYDYTADSVVAIDDNSEINVNNVDETNTNNNEYKEITKNGKDIKQANRYTYFNYYADSQHAKEYENNDLYTTVGKEESLYITVENSMLSSSPLSTEGNVTVSYQDKILGKVTNPNSGTQPITFSFDEAGTYDLTVEFTTPSGYFDGTQEFTVYVQGSTPVEKNTSITLKLNKTTNDINETFQILVSILPKNATGTITIYLDDSVLGQLETKSNDFGVNIALPYAGNYEFTATYTSNNTNLYEDSQTADSLPITINAIDTVINVDSIIYNKDSKTTTIKLTDANSNPVSNQKMDFIIYDTSNNIISNITTDATDNEGNVEVTLPNNLDVGSYNVVVNYNGGQWKTKKVSEYTTADDLVHEASTAQTTFTVEEVVPVEKNTTLSLSIDDNEVDINETITLHVSMQPKNATGTITIYLDDSALGQLETKSNDFGVNIALPYAGNYEFTATYTSNNTDLYEDSQTTIALPITVKAIDTIITVNPVETSLNQATTTTINLKDANSNAVTNQQVNALIYDANENIISNITTEKSDENGNIEIQIPDTLEEGIYNLIINYAGGQWKTKKVSEYTTADDLIHEASTAQTTITVTQSKIPTEIEIIVEDIKLKEGETKTVIINTNPEVNQGVVTVKKSSEIIATVDLSTSNSFDITDNLPSYYYPYNLVLSYEDDVGDYKASDVTMKVEKKTYNSNTYFNYYADSEHQVEYDTNSLDTLVGKEESLYITVENSYSSSSPLTTEGNITVSCDGEVIDKFTNPNSGSHEVKLLFDKAGTYTLVIEFETQSGYYNGIQEFTVNVEDKKEATPITLNIDDVTGDYGQTKTVTINTNPEVQQGIITIKNQEETIKTIDLSIDNTFDIELTKMTEGSYQLTISYYDENEEYKAEDATITVTINDARKETIITMDDVIGLINKTVTITAKVTDDQLNDITEGNVVFTNQEGDVLGQASVNNAIATITLTFDKELTTQITASYTSDNILIKPATTTAILTINKKLKTSIIVNEFNLTVGQKNNIIVNVIDENNNNVINGKVAFKINGKTVKDSNGKVIYAKVTNGQATLENYEIPDELINKNLTLSVAYSGSTGYESSKINNIAVNLTQSQKTLSIEKINDNVTVGSTITFKATVNSENPVNTGKVIFKINGKTVKDSNGKVVYALVTNGVATVDYEIPNTLKSKKYTVTAVYIDNNNERLEDSTNMTIINS